MKKLMIVLAISFASCSPKVQTKMYKDRQTTESKKKDRKTLRTLAVFGVGTYIVVTLMLGEDFLKE